MTEELERGQENATVSIPYLWELASRGIMEVDERRRGGHYSREAALLEVTSQMLAEAAAAAEAGKPMPNPTEQQ